MRENAIFLKGRNQNEFSMQITKNHLKVKLEKVSMTHDAVTIEIILVNVWWNSKYQTVN